MRWADRTFDFSSSEALAPQILERLRGTPRRLEERTSGLTPAHLSRRDGDRWSILENAGHMLDGEERLLARLDDLDAGLPELRGVDADPRPPTGSDPDAESVESIVARFRNARHRLVRRIEGMSPRELRRSALHPRLRTHLRVCDLMLVAAEHDDHHLARISELRRIRDEARVAVPPFELRYHHVGIPTEETHPGETHLRQFGMFVSGYEESPFSIEWMRFEADSPLPELVRRVPHVAFEVPDLEEALRGHDVLIPPNEPSEGIRVAFIVHNDAPVELLERTEAPPRPAEGAASTPG